MNTTNTTTTPASTRSPAALRKGLYTPGRASPSCAPGRWGGSSGNIPEQYVLEADGWNRKILTMVAYLRQAYFLLSEAENKIVTQQKKIAILEDLATTDELTSLKNRRGFQEAFLAEIDRSKRGTSKGGLLVMIDLDNFKTINDHHGHPCGDAVLKLVAQTLLNEIRKTDIAARLGGDEFTLLLTNTNKGEAAARAQMIGWKLNNLSLAWYGEIIPVHASVGLKSFGKDDQADSIMHAADTALYTSKFDRRFNRDLDTQHNRIGGTLG